VGDGKRIIIISITVSGINDYELTVAGLYIGDAPGCVTMPCYERNKSSMLATSSLSTVQSTSVLSPGASLCPILDQTGTPLNTHGTQRYTVHDSLTDVPSGSKGIPGVGKARTGKKGVVRQ